MPTKHETRTIKDAIEAIVSDPTAQPLTNQPATYTVYYWKEAELTVRLEELGFRRDIIREAIRRLEVRGELLRDTVTEVFGDGAERTETVESRALFTTLTFAEEYGEPLIAPKWDARHRELRLGNVVIRSFPVQAAPDCRKILGAFQRAKWEPEIANPFIDDLDPRKLERALRNLNKGLSRIRFGQKHGHVYWKLSDG